MKLSDILRVLEFALDKVEKGDTMNHIIVKKADGNYDIYINGKYIGTETTIDEVLNRIEKEMKNENQQILDRHFTE